MSFVNAKLMDCATTMHSITVTVLEMVRSNRRASRTCWSAAILTLAGLPIATVSADTSSIWISCSMPNDTLIVGIKSQIITHLDSGADTIGNAQCAYLWNFSGPNIIGPLYDTGQSPNVAESDDAHTGFDDFIWGFALGMRASSPDSTYYNFADILSGNGLWYGGGELFRITFVPSDTSTFYVLPAFGPQFNEVTITSDNYGSTLPLEFFSPVFRVVECTDANLTPGDFNFDRVASSADVIQLVNYVFRGADNAIVSIQSDINCDSGVSASDVILLVNHVFKSGAAPCDPCLNLN